MYLIIARHGDYDIESGLLVAKGENQSRYIAEKINEIVPQRGIVRILTSDQPRAVETAKIIAVHLGVSYDKHSILFSDGTHPCKSSEIYNLISDKSDVDVLVLVTHYDVTDEFPMAYSANEGWNRPLGYGGINYGRAWLIDTENQTKKLL